MSKWAESTQVLTPPVSAETSKSVTKHLIQVHVLPTVLSDVYWKDFKKQGAIVKLLPSHESARRLVNIVLDRAQREAAV